MRGGPSARGGTGRRPRCRGRGCVRAGVNRLGGSPARKQQEREREEIGNEPGKMRRSRRAPCGTAVDDARWKNWPAASAAPSRATRAKRASLEARHPPPRRARPTEHPPASAFRQAARGPRFPAAGNSKIAAAGASSVPSSTGRGSHAGASSTSVSGLPRPDFRSARSSTMGVIAVLTNLPDSESASISRGLVHRRLARLRERSRSGHLLYRWAGREEEAERDSGPLQEHARALSGARAGHPRTAPVRTAGDHRPAGRAGPCELSGVGEGRMQA